MAGAGGSTVAAVDTGAGDIADGVAKRDRAR
jgi:hypothetical protein